MWQLIALARCCGYAGLQLEMMTRNCSVPCGKASVMLRLSPGRIAAETVASSFKTHLAARREELNGRSYGTVLREGSSSEQ